MAIRLKYDPVGPLFLSSFQTGVQQGRDRRRREWEQNAMRLAAMFQQSQERALDRNADMMRDFNRNNVIVGRPAPKIPVAEKALPGGGFEFSGPSDSRTSGGMIDSPPASGAPLPSAPVGGLTGTTMPGVQTLPDGTQYMPRDVYEQQQRAEEERQRQAEADLAFRRRNLPDQPIPDGVARNPPVAREYAELQRQLREIMGNRSYDATNPDTIAKRQQIEDRMMEIENSNKMPTPEEELGKYSWYEDAEGNRVDKMVPGGSRWFWNPRSTSGPVRIDAGEEQAKKQQKEQQDAAKARRSKEIQQEEADLKRKEDAIRNDPSKTPAQQEKEIAALRKEFNDKNFPAGTTAGGGRPMRPATAKLMEQYKDFPEAVELLTAVAEIESKYDDDNNWSDVDYRTWSALSEALRRFREKHDSQTTPNQSTAGTAGGMFGEGGGSTSPPPTSTEPRPPLPPSATPEEEGQPLPGDLSKTPAAYWKDPNDRKTVFVPDLKTKKWKIEKDPAKVKQINLDFFQQAYDSILPEGKKYEELTGQEKAQLRWIIEQRQEVMKW